MMKTGLMCLLAIMAVGAMHQVAHFEPQQTYFYRLDTQVSSGLVGQANDAISQSAGTRLRSQVQLTFESERVARLQLADVELAQLNGELAMATGHQIQPFERFERRQFTQQQREQLELPLTFDYIDGTIQQIRFHEKDTVWSKNIKRSALNLLQLNLLRNNVQGLKMEKIGKQEQQLPVFTIPELTLEGECDVTYTIQKPSVANEQEQYQFNVTKSINFQRCRQTVDFTYGYSAKPANQLRCLNCLRAQNQQQKQDFDLEQIEELKYGQCQSECRPRQLNDDEDIDRSVVGRYELMGRPEKFGIRRASTVSHYVVKARSEQTENTVAQVVALAQLEFVKQTKSQKVESFKKASQPETLLYSAEWDLLEKKFYMYGDEEEEKQSPFGSVEKKEQRASHAMRSIVKSWAEEKEQPYELESGIYFNDLVTVLRQCSVKELKQIEKELIEVLAKQLGQKKIVEHVRSIYHSALAVAATRNTLWMLTEQIARKEMTVAKAVECLKLFRLNQHSPSDRQVDLIEKLCKNEMIQEEPALRQACWLNFGALVGQICQDKPSETQKEIFRRQVVCPESKKEQYKKTLVSLWSKSNTVYERVLALKTMGNSGLDIIIAELQKVLNDKEQPTLIRMEAIDAMRRLRTQIPQQIQQILLPIYQNQREQPEIRMTAFSMILYTHPEKAILDQLVFSTLSERYQNVKSYVLTHMNALAKSSCQAEQEIAQHMKTALKAIQINTEELKNSRYYRVPIYVSSEQTTDEQSFFGTMASIFSPTNMLPIHLAATLQTAANGQPIEDQLKLIFNQKDLEQWSEKLTQLYNQYVDEEISSESDSQSAKQLRTMYSSLGMKSRRSGSYYISSEESDESEQQQQKSESMKTKPFGMVVMRTNDIDNFVLPIEESLLPEMLKKIVRGEKPSLAGLQQWISKLAEGKSFVYHSAANLMEKRTKLPTGAGLPLAIVWQVSTVVSIDGQLKIDMPTKKAHLLARGAGIVSHQLRTECWTPVFASGIESIRTIEFAAPLDFTVELIQKSGSQQVQLTYRAPVEQQRLRLFGIHTLPLTYVRDFDMKARIYREQQVRTVRNQALLEQQRDIYTSEEHCFRAEGHVHWIRNWEQLGQIVYTTENNVHFYWQPQREAVREVIVRLTGQAFEQLAQHQRPEMERFYSNYRNVDDNEEWGLEKIEQREQKLSNFVSQYKPNAVYKHHIVVEVEARSPKKTHTVKTELNAQCDAQMKHCRAELKAVRSPFFAGESMNWQLKAKLQTVQPEIVREFETYETKQHRALVQLDCSWGAEEQQKFTIRAQAEPTKNSIFQNENTQKIQKSDKWSRFLNKFDILADYELNSESKQLVQRVYELIKAKYFWSMKVEQREQQQQGQLHARLIVDPITRRHANMSLKTVNEVVSFDSIRLPLRLPAYRLDRRQFVAHSIPQMVQRLSQVGNNAQCQIGQNRIRTFDGVDYRAPMSNCWTVLAKDCSREQPRFAVLMKQTDEKKVKIITPEQIIELQPCEDKTTQLERICVKINGQKVTSMEKLEKAGVELAGKRVYVETRAIQVRFDGESCQIKVSPVYKNTQCGLCGHYSDEESNVFRMSNNERASNLQQFHQSYTLKNEECNEEQLNQFYQQKTNQFILTNYDDEEQQQVEQGEERDYEQKQPEYGFLYRTQESSEEESRQSQEEKIFEQEQKIKPVHRTVIEEHQHKICFSKQPIKRCPKQSRPIELLNGEEGEEKKIEFVCVNRTDVEARRLVRQVRAGRQLDLKKYTISYVQTLQQPQQCVVAY